MPEASDRAAQIGILREVMASRAAFYSLLARLLLKPLDANEVEQLTDMDFIAQARAVDADGDGGLLAEGLNDMGRGLRRQHSGTVTQLATDYTMCFDGITNVDGESGLPYASLFLGKTKELYQQPRNSVYVLFLQSGLHLKKDVNLPEDHLSFEFEYLGIMASRAADHLSEGDVAKAKQAMADSLAFLGKHVCTWLPRYTEVALSILKTRFYRGVVKTARGYVELDEETLAQAIEACTALEESATEA